MPREPTPPKSEVLEFFSSHNVPITPVMAELYPPPTLFWLEFDLVSDGLETAAVQAMPLTMYHAAETPVFKHFSSLPTELRLKVWEYLIVPRIVGISCYILESGQPPPKQQHSANWATLPPSPPQVPILLQISHETRHLALQHYELSFQWKVPLVLSSQDLRPSAGLHPLPTTYHTNPYPETPSASEASLPIPDPKNCSPPHTYFNFALDAVYLLGELEPCDSFGFNSPMSYFLSSRDTTRVKKVGIPFRALRYGATGSQQIFGTLFHVVDRFTTAASSSILIGVNDNDEITHSYMGGLGRLVEDEAMDEVEDGLVDRREGLGVGARDVGIRASELRRRRREMERESNVLQKIWGENYRGSITTSKLVDCRFELLREEGLERKVYEFMTGDSGENVKGELKEGEVGKGKEREMSSGEAESAMVM
ncbi:hypothetical protein GGR57DRAFT_266551 [Xylariaceae sp. FL1272]|nr:hypothetical protein GGR57DRAFT_266551 [Xylariaceae sp. FL1272]